MWRWEWRWRWSWSHQKHAEIKVLVHIFWRGFGASVITSGSPFGIFCANSVLRFCSKFTEIQVYRTPRLISDNALSRRIGWASSLRHLCLMFFVPFDFASCNNSNTNCNTILLRDEMDEVYKLGFKLSKLGFMVESRLYVSSPAASLLICDGLRSIAPLNSFLFVWVSCELRFQTSSRSRSVVIPLFLVTFIHIIAWICVCVVEISCVTRSSYHLLNRTPWVHAKENSRGFEMSRCAEISIIRMGMVLAMAMVMFIVMRWMYWYVFLQTYPLAIIVGTAGCVAGFFMYRHLLHHPEV